MYIKIYQTKIYNIKLEIKKEPHTMKRTFTMKQALAESSEDLDESSHEPIPSTLKKQM